MHTIRFLLGLCIGMLLVVCELSAQPAIGYWPFSGNALDASGNGHNGTVRGATLTTDRFGTSNSAYNFDGVNDLIAVPDAPDLHFAPDGVHTISLWMKACARSSRSYTMLVSNSNSDGWNGYGLLIYLDGGVGNWLNGLVRRVVFPSQIAPVQILDGKWHHIVLIADSRLYEFWVDNRLVESSVWGGLPNRFYVTGPLYFAYYRKVHSVNPPAIVDSYFQGSLDDIRIYNRVITAAEVNTLYTERGWPNVTIPPISVTTQPTGSITICPGDSVQLQATQTGPVQRFIWRDAAGGYPEGLRAGDSSRTTVWVKPRFNTTYFAIATIGEPCPDQADTSQITVIVREGPQIPPGGTLYLCNGDSVRIGSAATGGTPGYRYLWDADPGITDRTQMQQWISPGAPRRYYVTVTDANGCSWRDTTYVVVLPGPQLPPLGRITLCRGSRDTIGAVATGVAPLRYRWRRVDGGDVLSELSSDTVARPEVRSDTTRLYAVEVIDGSSCHRYDTIEVVVVDLPIAEAGASRDLCRDSVTLLGLVAAQPNVSYAWSPSSGVNDTTLAQPEARPSTTTTYYVLATDTISGCTASDSITITVMDARLASTPTTLDFGELDGCTSSSDRVLTLRNDGTAPIVIDSVMLSEGSFRVVSPSVPIVLTPGETVGVIVRFAPSSGGVFNGELVLRGSPCGVEYRVTLRGSKVASDIVFSPTSIDFGAVAVCESVSRDTTITIANRGVTPLALGAGMVASPYSIISPTLPFTVSPGDSVMVVVRYAASGLGVYSEDLSLPYAVGSCRDTLRVGLSGRVVEPSVSLILPSGVVLSGCSTSDTLDVEILNDGEITVDVELVGLPSWAKLLSGVPVRLVAGDRGTARVIVTPPGRGVSSDVLTLRLLPCERDVAETLTVEQRGVEYSLVDTLDFGSVIGCGDTLLMQSAMLGYSSGAGDQATVRVVSVSGGLTTSLVTGAVVSDGGTLPFTVTWSASVEGAISGEIEIELEPCGVRRVIVVTGEFGRAGLRSLGSVDAGAQPIGSDTEVELLFVNAGSLPVSVGGIGALSEPFAFVRSVPNVPGDIASGDTLRVVVRYRGSMGSQSDTVRVGVISPCITQADAVVTGRGRASGEVLSELPRVSGDPGDRVALPVVIHGYSSALTTVTGTGWSGEIVFDGSILLPTGVEGAGSWWRDMGIGTNGRRRVEIGGSDSVVTLTAVALLGDIERTSLSWEGGKLLGSDTLLIAGSSGEFVLTGVCRVGDGGRLILSEGSLLKWVGPNPSHGGEIIALVRRVSGLRVWVEDIRGARVAEPVLVEGAGESDVRFDISDLSSGIYRVVADAAGWRETSMVVIIR